MSGLQHLASFVSRREGDENFDPTEKQGNAESDHSQNKSRERQHGASHATPQKEREVLKDGTDNRYRLEYAWRRSDSNKPSRDSTVKRVKRKRRMFGLEPHRRFKQHHEGSEKLWWSRVRATLQEPFSEFLGVLIFTMVQQGGIAQATLSAGDPTAPGGNGYGQYLTVPFW